MVDVQYRFQGKSIDVTPEISFLIKGGIMPSRIHALMVHHEEGPLTKLKLLLERQGMKTWRVRTCAEAEAALTRAAPRLRK